MKTTWIVDTYILEAQSVVGDLLGAIKSSGADLVTTKYVPFADQQDYGEVEPDHPVILYGTHGFVSKCHITFIPGAFGLVEQMNTNHYYSYVPLEWMMNSDFIILPFDVFRNHHAPIFDLFGGDLFIRPVSGFKTFAGMVVTRENVDYELNASQQITSVMPETLIMISSKKNLHGEFRFIIGNGRVIDGSEYRWDEKVDIRHDWPEDCWEVAKKMAEHSWQPDTVYTCDVAVTDDGPKIIELNSFACAGLYACDKNVVVGAINEIAKSEWNV